MEIEKAKQKGAVARGFSWFFLALLVLSLIGLIVCVIMGEIKNQDIFWFISFGCIGGILLFIGATLLCFKAAEKYRRIETDARERADSEDSYYIGEEYLATFTAAGLNIHGEKKEKKKPLQIKIPYAEVRIFTVTVRRSPKAKGEEKVLLEIPSRFVKKGGSEGPKEKTLIELEAKERLFATLKKFSLDVIEGSRKDPASRGEKKLSVKLKRGLGERSGIVNIVFGAALFAAGVLVSIFAKDVALLGYMLAVFGVVVTARGIFNTVAGNGALVVYEGGVYWKEKNRFERSYIPFDDIVTISRLSRESMSFVAFTCAFGTYHYPDLNGLYEGLKQLVPEKIEKEKQ